MANNIYLLNDHKTGFNITNTIVGIINKTAKQQIKTRTFYLFWNNYQKNNKYIILVRNPKEIICSGYLYHKKKCKESWSLIKNGYYYGYWENHFPKQSLVENKKYLDFAKSFSNPIPYQKKLQDLSLNEGMITEMNNVGYLTITGMYNLIHYGKKNVYLLKYEDLVFNHDETITKLCEFIGLSQAEIKNILKLSIKHNLIYQKNNNKITNHTTNKDVNPNRYLKYWNDKIDTEFNKLFPDDIMEKFGYSP
tara:strand:- start:656 stop:1405 length:750 start_codon:yes stop_codon:yes gene_type:complete